MRLFVPVLITLLAAPVVVAQRGDDAARPEASDIAKAYRAMMKSVAFPRFDRSRASEPGYRDQMMKERKAALERRKVAAQAMLEERADALASGDGLYYRGMLQNIVGEAKASAASFAAFRAQVDEHPMRAQAGLSLLQSMVYVTKDVDGFRKLLAELESEGLNERQTASLNRLKGQLPSFEKRQSLVGKPLPTIPIEDVVGAEGFTFPVKGKVTVIDFWATWCGPCRRIIPGLVELQKKHGDALQVVGLTKYYGYGWELTGRTGDAMMGKGEGSRRDPISKERERELNEIFHKGVLNYPIVFTGAKTAADTFGVRGIPTVFVVDRSGVVRWYKVGAGDEKALPAVIAKLLADS